MLEGVRVHRSVGRWAPAHEHPVTLRAYPLSGCSSFAQAAGPGFGKQICSPAVGVVLRQHPPLSGLGPEVPPQCGTVPQTWPLPGPDSCVLWPSSGKTGWLWLASPGISYSFLARAPCQWSGFTLALDSVLRCSLHPAPAYPSPALKRRPITLCPCGGGVSSPGCQFPEWSPSWALSGH